MGAIEAGYACAYVQEFNALLLRWLGELTEKTIAGGIGMISSHNIKVTFTDTRSE